MFLHDARLRLKEALDIVLQRADGLLYEGRTALDIIGDVARYARGRVREQYLGEPTDPVAAILNAFIIEAGNELIEGKKTTAMAIADEKRLAKQIEIEAQNAQEWEKRALMAAEANLDALVQEALDRKREHMDLVDNLRAEWETQRAFVDDLKVTLRRFNQLIEKAKRTKDRLTTRRFVRRADELKQQVERMDRIVKGLDLMAEFDRSSKPVKDQKPEDGRP